ncbi:DUF4258 domain-containing protein [Rhodopseudomonas pseudopalustris]|uniref:DUF4258 domain-containing protein n=1 Tax=Rhodopseudomonas pseudopalustris TaxID=1513892 RepID=A0A1H8X660_9BRAD|nr:DUF4258 domain-containing protein [Rhodopseudomonas pseudopalustris]SEP34808.1 protein of unknown function [Rhodopseudomonas pseudopalustris]
MAATKPLTFTKHAQDAILERKLELGWIDRTVREPDWSHPDPVRTGVERRFRAIPEFGGRILRVACLENADEIRILTVFFDRDARGPT